MKTLNKEVTNVLKNHEFNVGKITKQDNIFYVELNQHTPLGEDWWITILFDGTNEGFIQNVRKYYNSFDVDEEVEPLVNNRGKHGIPSSIRSLVEDAEWKEEKLSQLTRDLEYLDIEECYEEE